MPINQCPNASTTLALELPTQGNWGAQNLTGKVTINCAAPPEGLTVQIISNYSGIFLTPKTIKIQPGKKSAVFNFSIQPDASSYPNGLTIEVSATWNAIDLVQRSITLPPL
ncbi:MAG: hypothetical protein HC796_11285 [Synechococcaceae cyanobacterium RL_1_2]|nr:hypothetical protein [Synechococcaceae cyanobacterium RL_1_2]